MVNTILTIYMCVYVCVHHDHHNDHRSYVILVDKISRATMFSPPSLFDLWLNNTFPGCCAYIMYNKVTQLILENAAAVKNTEELL